MAIDLPPQLARFEQARAAELGGAAERLTDRRADGAREAVVVRDPAAMMADMAEELGFIQAEAAGGTEEAEEDADAAFEDLIDDLIRKSLEMTERTQPVGDKNEMEALRERILRGAVQGRPGHALNEALRQFTGGSSQKGLALMEKLAELAKTDPALQRLGYGPQAVEAFAIAHESGLIAALNIAEVLSDAAPAVPDTAQRMLSMYEASIAASQSVLQTFQRLGQSEGIGTVNDWRKFLTEAVAADLSRQNSSGEKAQLQLSSRAFAPSTP